jgi:hypothetical protein
MKGLRTLQVGLVVIGGTLARESGFKVETIHGFKTVERSLLYKFGG